MSTNIEELKYRIKACDEHKPYVFISYSKKDAERVYPVVLDLQSRGVNLWIDKILEGTAGTAWNENAFNSIANEKCKRLVFFMSVNSFLSVPVCSEIEYTRASKTTLYHDNEALPVVPYSLSAEKNIKTLVDQVKEYVKKLPEKERTVDESDIQTFEKGFTDPKQNEVVVGVNKSYFALQVFRDRFDNNGAITTVSDIDSLMGNIPDECIDDQNLKEVKQEKNKGRSVSADESTTKINIIKDSENGKDISSVHNDDDITEINIAEKITHHKEEPIAPIQAEMHDTVNVDEDGNAVTIGTIREIFDNKSSAQAFRPYRESMPFGGKAAMDYAMAAVLSGCNQITAKSPAYQINYYVYDIAAPGKETNGALGATWTWSSNCRKILNIKGSGQIPEDINAVFKGLPETTKLGELINKFCTVEGDAFRTKKNDMILTAFEKIKEFVKTLN